MIRLQKYLSEAGVASRRAAEEMIAAGQVTVNGAPVTELGTRVDPARDEVEVDGVPVKAKRKLYVALNKPPKVICTRNDPEKRRQIGEFLPSEWNHLFSVGRLDYESEGLIFLTNDGDFCLKLTHPRYGIRKVYRATVEGRVALSQLAEARNGVRDEGEWLQAEGARLIDANNTRSLVELTLTEGRNREVRRLLGALGLVVERLQRIQIGPIRLAELPEGRWRTLTETEIQSLLGTYENKPADTGSARNGALHRGNRRRVGVRRGNKHPRHPGSEEKRSGPGGFKAEPRQRARPRRDDRRDRRPPAKGPARHRA